MKLRAMNHFGYRTKNGRHTSIVLIQHKGMYYISTKAGMRKATKKEIARGKVQALS